MIYTAIILLGIGVIAGILFLQLLFSEYCLASDRETMARRIMEYSDESIGQLPRFREILLELDDMLARSLPPEEYESDEMLDKMDREKKQMQAEHVYLIAFLSDYYDALSYKGIEFRCKLGIPERFEKDCLDVLVLYDYLLTAGQDAVEYEMQKRLSEELEGGEETHTPVKADMIRIRESSQFGLWHLHMDVTISDVEWHDDGRLLPRLYKERRFRRNRRVVRRILNKHRLKLRSKYVGNRFEIDIIT